MTLRKKIFFNISIFFTILFALTLVVGIMYLNYDHKYHSINNANNLSEYLVRQIEVLYISNNSEQLQLLLDKTVARHENISGIYIEKDGVVIYKSLMDLDNKSLKIIENSLSYENELLQFKDIVENNYYISSSKIGNGSSIFHLLISKEKMWHQTRSELSAILFISFCFLLLGLFIANEVSKLLTKEIDKKNDTLKKKDQKWNLLFNSSPVGIVIIDQNGIITQSNTKMKELFNFSSDQIEGKHISESIEQNSNSSFSNYFSNFEQLHFTETEVTITREGGNIINILRILVPLISSENTNIGAMIYYSNITEKKRKEKELNLYKTKLEELVDIRTIELQSTNELLSQEIAEREAIENNLKKMNADKDKLFSIIAHDLRSPFNALLGSSDLLQNEIDSLTLEEIKGLTETLYDSANGAYKLLENLLTWATLQTGQIDYLPEYCDLAELTGDIFTLYNPLALKKGIRLSNNITNNIVIFADKNMITTVLRNLVSNAIKFTENRDEIDINCSLQNEFAVVSVTDTGVGMSEDFVEKLFHINHNSSTNGTNGERGTGLGLILVKDFIEINKGKLTVESSKGIGSTFSFTIPLKKVALF